MPAHLPTRSASLTILTLAALMVTFVVVAFTRAAGTARADASLSRMNRYRAAIPQQAYQALVISPRGGIGDQSPMFVIRARDAGGEVEDFAFHAKPGETFTLTFPDGGWNPKGESILETDADVAFAAWGITAAGLVRFEDVRRDPADDVAERDRRRDLEEFQRERQRNRDNR